MQSDQQPPFNHGRFATLSPPLSLCQLCISYSLSLSRISSLPQEAGLPENESFARQLRAIFDVRRAMESKDLDAAFMYVWTFRNSVSGYQYYW